VAQHGIVNVSGYKKHLDAGTFVYEALHKFISAHPRHHHVGDEEIDGVMKGLALLQRFKPVLAWDDLIAVEGKHLHDELANHPLVLGQKNGFGAAQGRSRRFQRNSLGDFIVTRQIDLDGGTLPQFAVAPDVAPALFNDAMHSGQTQSRAFALFFGREEWLEYPGLRGIVHATSIVSHG